MATKIIQVKAHTRTIHTRLYKFVCKQCNKKTERESYPGGIPIYCVSCRPPKPEKKDNVIQFIPSKPLLARVKRKA